jgi:phosphatidylglycerophosphatase A
LPAIKESSDELNPAVVVPAAEVATRRRRSPADYLALAVATCGVGYFPIAPGTLGSLVGIALYLPLFAWTYQLLEDRAVLGRLSAAHVFVPQLAIMLSVVFLITMAGIWAASQVERVLQKKDPSIVVIDEVAGQMIALFSVMFWLPTWWNLLSAFILFRAFDIWKPYPIRRLEALESGLGIMADDVLAGVYALIANSIISSVYLLLIGH